MVSDKWKLSWNYRIDANFIKNICIYFDKEIVLGLYKILLISKIGWSIYAVCLCYENEGSTQQIIAVMGQPNASSLITLLQTLIPW